MSKGETKRGNPIQTTLMESSDPFKNVPEVGDATLNLDTEQNLGNSTTTYSGMSTQFYNKMYNKKIYVYLNIK